MKHRNWNIAAGWKKRQANGRDMARRKNEQGRRSGRRLRSTNLLAQCISDVLRSEWTDEDKIQPKIIPIHPLDRRSFNLYRRAIIRERDAQCQIEARLNCMVTLNTHP